MNMKLIRVRNSPIFPYWLALLFATIVTCHYDFIYIRGIVIDSKMFQVFESRYILGYIKIGIVIW